MVLGPKSIPLIAALVGAAAGGAFAQAQGQDCSAGIDHLAQHHHLGSEPPGIGGPPQPATGIAPPATTESRGLAENQPITPSQRAFTPAPPPKGMSTTGSDVPPPPVAAAPGGGASDLPAADRGRMEALLKAARDADRRGDRTLCLDRLHEAQAITAPARRTR